MEAKNKSIVNNNQTGVNTSCEPQKADLYYQFTNEERIIIESLNASQKALFDKLTDITIKRMYLRIGSVSKKQQLINMKSQPYDLVVEKSNGDTYHSNVQKIRGKTLQQVCENYWKVLGIGNAIYYDGHLIINSEGKIV